MSMKVTLGRFLARVCVVALSVAFLSAASGCAQKSCTASGSCQKNASKCGKDCKKKCCAKAGAKCGSAKKCAADCKKACCSKKTSSAANSNCPISGKPANSAITAAYNGKTVAFCCGGCIGRWDNLSDGDKAAKLASAK